MLFVVLVIAFFASSVMIHEYAHYKTGMLLGINPVEVGIGFGPKLYSKQLKKYKFCIKLLPLGGYVSYGENMFNEEIFYQAKPWKRLLITLAGPVSNLIYAFILILGVGVYNEIVNEGFSLIGIWRSLFTAGRDTYEMGSIVITSTIEHFAENVSSPVELINFFTGPVGAYKAIALYQNHPEYLVLVFAAINVALFIFNMLPFPALDGGTVFTSLTEIITRRKLNTKVLTVVNFAGFIIIMGLSTVLLCWDIISKLLIKLIANS